MAGVELFDFSAVQGRFTSDDLSQPGFFGSRHYERRVLRAYRRRLRHDCRLPRSGGADGQGEEISFKVRGRHLPVPWHQASMRRASLLDPFIFSHSQSYPGPLLGRTGSGQPFGLDVWELYDMGLVTSTGMVWVGKMGSGKSMGMKITASREVGYGRRVIVAQDPNGEWSGLAEALGGQTVRLGPGVCLNPLAVSGRLSPADAAARRLDVLGLLFDIIEAGERREDEAVLQAALTDPANRDPEATCISSLIDWLGSHTNIRALGVPDSEPARNRLLMLLANLSNKCGGLLAKPSTLLWDPLSPMIVFDTSSSQLRDPTAKALYQAVIDSTIDSVLDCGDGAKRILVYEEGHDALRHEQSVRRIDRLTRLGGHLGVSLWLQLHEFTDIYKYADRDSGTRKLIEGIFQLSELQLVFAQTPASAAAMRDVIPDMTDEEAAIAVDLPQGFALWRIGSGERAGRLIAQPVPSQVLYGLINTDRNRSDRGLSRDRGPLRRSPVS